jgi:hypothetical protein
MNNSNQFDMDRMRTEIAILQEDIDAKHPGIAKFKIPVIMSNDNIAHITTNNYNISNKKTGNIKSSAININNYIALRVPEEFTYFWPTEKVPAGTRFIVTFVGGNVNDIRIIGRYDYE